MTQRNGARASMHVERILPAWDGVDTNDAPQMTSSTMAPVVDNFIVGRKGKLLMRGPINQSVQLDTVDHNPIGIWVYDDKLCVCTGTSSYTGGSLGARYPTTTTVTGSAVWVVNLASLTATAVTLVSGQLPGGISTRLGSYVYGCQAAGGPTSVGDTNGPTASLWGMVRWDGTSVAGGFYEMLHAPKGFFDAKAYLNRLFVLGGLPPDGSSAFIEPNTLFWSIPGGPTADTTANWQDSVSGLLNRIVIESDDRNDTSVGLARLGKSLAILKRKSIHLLVGQTPSSFTVQHVVSGLGCLGRTSIVELSDSCVFASDTGLMLFDGAQVVNLSKSIQAEFLSAALTTNARVFCGRLAGDNISVVIRDASNNILFAKMLHLPSRAWWTLSSNSLAHTYPWQADMSALAAWAYDGRGIYLLDKALTPELAPVTERGYDQVGVAKTRIPARWWSRLAQLALPTNRAQLKRVLLDYIFYINGGTDSDNGWYVSLVTGDGRTVLAETRVPAQAGSGSTYIYRRQASIDAYSESAHDVQLRVEWREDGANYPAVSRAELHDAYIEFQSAQQRQST